MYTCRCEFIRTAEPDINTCVRINSHLHIFQTGEPVCTLLNIIKSIIMKLTKIFTTLIFILASQVAQAGNDVKQGGKLYKTYCSACHGASGGMDMSKRVAPPIIAVRMHYIAPYPDKASFIAAVTSWVEKQDASKTLMRGAIRKFNIMPPVQVSREDAQKIAAYIYEGNVDKPGGFDEHYEQMHGKQRMTPAM